MSAHRQSDDSALIGRTRERDLVEAMLDALPDGGRVLRLTGEPGSGKTALVRFAARAAAQRGTPVLSVTWAPAERDLGHAALHGLLHPVLPHLGDLPGSERAALASAFGEAPGEPEPTVLARAALRLITRLPGPVLVCVDDLDRLDPASRDTLRAMTHLCHDTRAGILVTGRTADDHLPADARTVALPPFPARHARDLVRRRGRARAHTEEELILAVAGGNALALTELSLSGTGLPEAAGFGMLPATPRLADAFADDLRGLSAEGDSVLLTAALSTSTLVREILDASARLLGDAEHARAGLDEVLARGLIAAEPAETGAPAEPAEKVAPAAPAETVAPAGHSHLRFTQPLLRIAALHRVPATRRMTAHAALGHSITDPTRAAWHAAQCATGTDEELARRVEALAAGPRPDTSLLVALAALETAARLSPDPERRAGRLLRAAELACHYGLGDQARQYARGIDPAELGDLGRAMLLWLHDLLPGNPPVGAERIGQLCAAARSVAAGHPALARKLLHAAAGRCWWEQAAAPEREMVVATLKELRTSPWQPRELAALALTDPLSISHTPLRVAEPPTPDEQLILGQVAHLTGDLERAGQLLEAAERAARATGRHGRLPHILGARALGEIWRGTQWKTAHTMADEARTIATRLRLDNYGARATGALGLIEALQGHHDKALERAAAIEGASRHLGQGQHLNLATLTRVLTASGSGRYADAYTQLRSSFTQLTTPYSFQQFWGLAFFVEAALPAGEAEDARTVVKEIADRTSGGRAPLLRQILAYADAALAPDEEAEARYRAALDGDIDRWPLLHAMTRLSHGVWLRRRRRVVESRAPLTAAESLFRSLGATSRADLAASELRAAGRTDSAPDQDSPAAALSPQQLTIARLAADGLTNRAIGEQLHLSARTVASHLYQIFPKLGVNSRAQLAQRTDLR
ncbi:MULTISPECIES: LuxR family transcriptional regulator [unclassified Streptomyces]|uniref:helix-turn-helix transcriptional regulator n=1 Tax=unclassified Streptomyces TaxID=2593676 RepID=UPI000DBAD095|nr:MULTISPECIES: LuxR family transcriptional regulator [unclassified Streptomyces]MYT69076.1 AAA family ATPase [Streptomyces sp. SID8367]RAJ82587.1 regulatory LuxR family protein [Streptomyces sp. PsTaAH-137]